MRLGTAAVGLLAMTLAACGGAVRFIPDCVVPEAGDRARPVAVIPLGDGTYAGLNADTDEAFCGGFVTLLDTHGEIDEPFLLPVGNSWEGNFVAAATTHTHLWIAGRRLGTLLGVDLATRQIDVVREGVAAERVFYAGGDMVAVTRLPAGEPPRLAWYDDAGALVADAVLSTTRILAAAYDPERGRLWLAGEGGNVLAVDTAALDTVQRYFPFGLNVTYNLRGLAIHDDIVWAADSARALVARWRSADGQPQDASALGFRPEAMAIDPSGRIWVVDALGDVYIYAGHVWQRLVTGLERPVAIAADATGAWVADFAAQQFVRLPAP